jgi:hypothetical protein
MTNYSFLDQKPPSCHNTTQQTRERQKIQYQCFENLNGVDFYKHRDDALPIRLRPTSTLPHRWWQAGVVPWRRSFAACGLGCSGQHLGSPHRISFRPDLVHFLMREKPDLFLLHDHTISQAQQSASQPSTSPNTKNNSLNGISSRNRQ